MNDVLLNLSESAKIMRCSYSKAQRIARAGEMPFRKIGSNWVIARSALYRSAPESLLFIVIVLEAIVRIRLRGGYQDLLVIHVHAPVAQQ